MASERTTVGCPKCGTFSTKETAEEAEQAVQDHNDRMHVQEIARRLDPDNKDVLDEFMEQASDLMDRHQYKKLVQKVVSGKTPFPAKADY